MSAELVIKKLKKFHQTVVVAESYAVIDPTVYGKVWEDRWLKRYATALIKKQWGANLQKFNNLQLPGGVTLNADKIIEEAVAEITALEEDMENSYGGVLEFYLN